MHVSIQSMTQNQFRYVVQVNSVFVRLAKFRRLKYTHKTASNFCIKFPNNVSRPFFVSAFGKRLK